MPGKNQIEQAFKRAAGLAAADEPDARSGRYRLATVYFVREGSGSVDARTNEGEEFALQDIAKAFAHITAIWSKTPRVFNPERDVNPYSAYLYVVVHVRGAEPTGQFTRDGYWTLDGVSPADFRKAMSLAIA